MPEVDVVGDDVEPIEARLRLADHAPRPQLLELALLDPLLRLVCDGAVRPHCVVAEEMMLDVAPRLRDGCRA